MENLTQTKVSKIVAQNYKTAKVFTQYGVDFCCNGGISLAEACKNKNIDIDQVVGQLEQQLREPDEQNFQKMDHSQLVDHIVSTHHNYVENTIPVIKTYLEKLCSVHGDRHPELFEIKQLFDEGAGALTAHMKKEEFILFPYIKSMQKSLLTGETLRAPHFGDINNPILMMEMEHAAEGERFRKISEISNGYTCPPDGCQTYRVAFAVLDEFEKDLHKHIHLENNILFPKAIELHTFLSN